MRISLPDPLAWENANDSWKAARGIPDEIGTRVYHGGTHALYEFVMGTALFFNHKRSVGFVQGNSWLTLQPSGYFYKEGYKVQLERWENAVDWKAWVDQLPTDTVAVVWCSDHPVTGAVFDGDALDARLNEKKIYSVRVTHSTKSSGSELRNFSTRIYEAGSAFAWAEFGRRFKTPPLMSHQMAPPAAPSLEKFEEDQKIVEDFENSAPEGFQKVVTTARLFDRAVLFHSGVHGGLLLEELAKRIGHQLQPAARDSLLASTNLCQESRFNQYKDWWSPTPADDMIRGLVVLGLPVLRLPGIREKFQESVQACQTKFVIGS